MSFMWRYFFATFTLFFIAPELRRIQDMFVGYSPIEIWSVLPIVMLVPFFYIVAMNDRYRRIPPIFQKISWLWVSAFVYGLFLSFLQHNLAAGLLTFLEFVLPLGAGLWLVTEPMPASLAFNRVLNYLFIAGTFLAVYGVVQWAVIPPWDALWLHNVHASSFGTAVPFQLRAFSTLNAPGNFSVAMALIAILGLPRLTTANWRFIAAYSSWIVALGVTIVRTSWVMFVMGAIIYFLLTRRFKQLFTIVAVGAVMVIGIGLVDPSNPVIALVGDRVSSFSNIQGDESFSQRSDLYVDMIPSVLQGPVGMGLGVFGAGGKLNSDGMQIDSGILSRLLEMGWAGFALLGVALLSALTFTVRGLVRVHKGIGPHFDMCATLIAVQIALLFLMTSGESHLGVIGLIFWTTLAPSALPHRTLLRTTVHQVDKDKTTVSGTA